MQVTQGFVDRIPERLLVPLLRNAELFKFLVVGAFTFVITSAIFFGLKWTVLHEKPVTANIIAVLIATIVSYVLNREWSFTARGGRQRHHEAAAFFLVSGAGLAINQVPLWISSYVFDLRTPNVSLAVENIADFVSALILGTLLATAFRWWAMRRFVFPEQTSPAAEDVSPVETPPSAQ